MPLKIITPLVFVTIMLCGCSRVYQVSSPERAHAYFDRSTGTLHLADSTRIDAEEITVFGDSLLFTEKNTGVASRLALGDITTVTRVNHAAGFMGGAVITLAALAAERTLLTLFTNRSRYGTNGAGRYVLAGTAIGGALGAIGSAVRGINETYVLDHDSLRITAAGIGDPIVPSERDPLDVKIGIRAGIELGNFASAHSGSYSIEPGFTFGLMTGVRLYRAEESAVILGIEAGYTRLMGYDRGGNFYWYGRYRYRYEYDQRRQFSFFELGLLPSFQFPLGKDVVGSVYAGGSAGIGSKYIRSASVSNTLVDSTSDYHYIDYTEEGENTNIMATGCITAGVSVFYKHVMVDLRYKYSSIGHEMDYKNLYLQIGLVL